MATTHSCQICGMKGFKTWEAYSTHHNLNHETSALESSPRHVLVDPTPAAQSLVRSGWATHDIVKVHRDWCLICAKNRLMETYNGKTLCFGCYDITNVIVEPPQTLEHTYGEIVLSQ